MTLIFIAAALLTSPFSEAKSSTVLELQRVNYKNEKRLIYDLNFNPATCEIDRNQPFDTYYRDNKTGARDPEFSKSSEKFFGPRLEGVRISAHEAPLSFKGFDEIEIALNMRARLVARVERVQGKCVASAEITYTTKRFTIERIELKVKKALGIPNGVEWVLLKGRGERGRIVDCVAGDCGR